MNKKDAHEFLTKLVRKIKESDKKEGGVDSKPTLFYIQERRRLTAADGCGDGVWYRHNDDGELTFYTDEELDTFLDENQDYCADDFSQVEYQALWETKELAFLTRESAKNHIACNHYHYTNPRTYSRGVWRDPLMEGLFKALHTLYGNSEIEKEDGKS